MTNEKEVTEKVDRIIDQAVGNKMVRICPKTTYPPPGSKTARQFNLFGYTKNIPIERPYIWLIVDEEDVSRIFHAFDASIWEAFRGDAVTIKTPWIILQAMAVMDDLWVNCVNGA